MKNFALIFAGGIGQRMNTVSLPKQFLKVHGKEIIVHTIEHFQTNSLIDEIVVVCLSDFIPLMTELKNKYDFNKVKHIVSGGKSGQESIFNGLNILHKLSNDKNDIVLIHDGVRPIIDQDTINKNIESVKEYGNGITVSKATESVLIINKNDVDKVEDRNRCYYGRAPQSFLLDEIYQCHIKAIKEGKTEFVDSSMLMQYYGYKMHIVEGPVNNIKVTTPMDFYIFRSILDAKENEQIKIL